MTRPLAGVVILAVGTGCWLVSDAIAGYAPEGATETLGVVLNILKIVGIIAAGAAAIISTLSETKTEDKRHLTIGGRLLLFMGVVGIAVALAAQIFEWIKVSRDEREIRIQNRMLLEQIQRAVTRFQDLSMDFDSDLPIGSVAFTPYMEDLRARISSIPADITASQEREGFEILDSPFRTLLARGGSPALPDEKAHPEAYRYLQYTTPYVYLFKKPISPEKFSTLTPADLVLLPKESREVVALFFLGESKRVNKISYLRAGMQIAWGDRASTGNIQSEKDLVGAQLFIFPGAYKALGQINLWNQSKVNSLALFINGRRFDIRDTALNRVVIDMPFYGIAYWCTFPCSSNPNSSLDGSAH